MERFWQTVQDNLPWLYAILLSVWGGLVQYAGKVRSGEPPSWSNIIADLLICSFAGLTAFFICNTQGVDGWHMALIVSISAHEGPKAIAAWSKLKSGMLK